MISQDDFLICLKNLDGNFKPYSFRSTEELHLIPDGFELPVNKASVLLRFDCAISTRNIVKSLAAWLYYLSAVQSNTCDLVYANMPFYHYATNAFLNDMIEFDVMINMDNIEIFVIPDKSNPNIMIYLGWFAKARNVDMESQILKCILSSYNSCCFWM